MQPLVQNSSFIMKKFLILNILSKSLRYDTSPDRRIFPMVTEIFIIQDQKIFMNRWSQYCGSLVSCEQSRLSVSTGLEWQT